MNNNRKEHISWTFICLLFLLLALFVSFYVGLFLLIFLSFSLSSSAWVLHTSWKTSFKSLHLVGRRWCLQRKTTQDSSEGRDFGKFYEKTWILSWIIYMVKARELPLTQTQRGYSLANTLTVWWRSSERSEMIHGQVGSGHGECRGEDLYGELSAFKHLFFKSSISPRR